MSAIIPKVSSPWSKIDKQVEYSLKDVMSEQLANELQENEIKLLHCDSEKYIKIT